MTAVHDARVEHTRSSTVSGWKVISPTPVVKEFEVMCIADRETDVISAVFVFPDALGTDPFPL
ncbi:hypothetical protein, partial [Burkholderia sp. Se-20378]|uniref:hypothetical protein n=1 Tax=Burkholderia sp. Se-20378 TaxID=2703899 RepID=UPI001981302C